MLKRKRNVKERKYTKGQKLGEGSFGKVYAEYWKGQWCAAKHFSLDMYRQRFEDKEEILMQHQKKTLEEKQSLIRGERKDAFDREFETLTHLHNLQEEKGVQPHIVQFLGADPQTYTLYLELCPMDLATYLSQHKSSLSWEKVKGWLLQLITTLKWIHQYHLYHLDISLNNIMYVPQTDRLVLVDWGQARRIKDFKSWERFREHEFVQRELCAVRRILAHILSDQHFCTSPTALQMISNIAFGAFNFEKHAHFHFCTLILSDNAVARRCICNIFNMKFSSLSDMVQDKWF